MRSDFALPLALVVALSVGWLMGHTSVDQDTFARGYVTGYAHALGQEPETLNIKDCTDMDGEGLPRLPGCN